MKMFLYLTSIILFTCCSSGGESGVSGEYFGFWAETIWSIKLSDNNTFKIESEGHFGNTKAEGKYSLINDTLILDLPENSAIAKYTDHRKFITDDECLVDVESRYDYCKTRPEVWSSLKRNIYYPQIDIDSERNCKIVMSMLQTAIAKLQSDTQQDCTIYMEEYYEINKRNGYEFNRFGKDITLLSKTELRENGIINYISIEDFDLGQKSALVHIIIEPYLETFNSAIVTFKKVNMEWVSDDYID